MNYISRNTKANWEKLNNRRIEQHTKTGNQEKDFLFFCAHFWHFQKSIVLCRAKGIERNFLSHLVKEFNQFIEQEYLKFSDVKIRLDMIQWTCHIKTFSITERSLTMSERRKDNPKTA